MPGSGQRGLLSGAFFCCVALFLEWVDFEHKDIVYYLKNVKKENEYVKGI